MGRKMISSFVRFSLGCTASDKGDDGGGCSVCGFRNYARGAPGRKIGNQSIAKRRGSEEDFRGFALPLGGCQVSFCGFR